LICSSYLFHLYCVPRPYPGPSWWASPASMTDKTCNSWTCFKWSMDWPRPHQLHYCLLLFIFYGCDCTCGLLTVTRGLFKKFCPTFFFLRIYLFKMVEIWWQYKWMFLLHTLYFCRVSINLYGLTPVWNKCMYSLLVPALVLPA
jgi:hypothetical protein